MALPARHRLRDADELRRMMRMKPAQSAGFMALYWRKAPSGVRFAVVVPAKSVPRASARNALRRRVVGALEALAMQCRDGVHCVVVVRSVSVPRGEALRKQLRDLFLRADLLT